MKKFLIVTIMLSFSLVFSVTNAASTPTPTPAAEDALMKACKNKKAGTQVTVAARKMNCPKTPTTTPLR